MATPTVAWDETAPPDTRAISPETLRSEGEARIREFKTQFRELIAIDHQMDYVYGSSQQDTDWGHHNKMTLIESAADQSAVTDSVVLYTKAVNSIAEAFFVDEDSDSQQLTSNGSWIAGMTGEVRMWRGSLANLVLTPGWELCDGVSGRPNLINKFVRCIRTAATEPQANSGGSHTISIPDGSIPAHTHTLSGGSHTHNLAGGTSATEGNDWINVKAVTTLVGPKTTGSPYWQWNHSHAVLGSTGSESAYNTRPAYYELAYIIKT